MAQCPHSVAAPSFSVILSHAWEKKDHIAFFFFCMRLWSVLMTLGKVRM